MAKHCKYIVINNPRLDPDFRFGYVEFHRHLANDKEQQFIIGGGMFEVDEPNKEVVLYGTSSDFGKVPNLSEWVKKHKQTILGEVQEFYWIHTDKDIDMSGFTIVVMDDAPERI